MDTIDLDSITDTCFCSWWGIAAWFMIGLMLLSHLNTPLQYTIKMFLLYSWMLITATVLIPVGLIMPFRAENHRYFAYMIPFFRYLILNFDVEVRGKENLVSETPFVLVLNHQSSLDLYVMMHIWPERCVAFMKHELKWVFPLGPVAWLFGSILVNRRNQSQAQDAIKHAVKEIVDRNVKIVMYPEGTRSRDGKLLPFKKGAFNLAVYAQVPLVPAVIANYSSFYSRKENKFTPGKVIVTVLPPIKTAGLKYEDVPRLVDSTRDTMVEVYERSSAELLQSLFKSD